MNAICFRCSKDTGLNAQSEVFRSTDCPHCHADLRSCKMCRFYDEKSYNECRESQAERITEKEKANFCGYFEFIARQSTLEQKATFMNAADALFKK